MGTAQKMFLFSLNGDMMGKDEFVKDRVTCALVTRNGEYLITGSQDCCVSVRLLHASLGVVHKVRSQAPITSLTITADEHNILLGTADGKIAIIGGEYPKRQKP